MAYTIANLKTDLSSVLHGTNIDKVNAPLALINRAARQLLADVDLHETRQVAQITGGIFDDVHNYTAPTDLKGNKIIDLRPQVNRERSDNFSQNLGEYFDLNKNDNSFQVMMDGNTKYIRINKDLGDGTLISGFESLTSQGTWSATSDAENLTLDKLNYVSGNSSFNFDVDGATTSGYIEVTDLTSVNLSTHEDISSLFMWGYIPSASAFTSYNLRWGSDSSNYWHVTSTSPFFGSFVDGWNLVQFDWNGATEVNSPSSSGIDYLRITVNYDGTADTDFRIDSLVSSVGQIFDIVYYSKYLFANSGGTRIEEATADTDTVNLDTESYNLLLDKCAEFAAQQLQGEDAQFDVSFFEKRYKENLRRYKRLYPSEVEKPRQYYYKMR